ncbi:MAG: ABC transporter permease, partial [Myxococcales bacterium]
MNALASLKTALRALTKNKLRSMLAMLGIVIAVSAVVATVAIGQGAQAKVAKQMESLGSNLLMVLPGSMANHGVATGTGAQQSLTRDDAAAIERDLGESVAAVSPVSRTSGQVLYGGQNWFTSIQGVSPSYLQIRNATLAEGEPFTREQDASAAKVAIIGKTVADKLFPNGAEIVGQQIRVKQEPVTVIGVLAAKGQSSFGQDQDDVILMPWTTVARRLIGSQSNTVGQIMVLAQSASQIAQAQSDVTALLSQRHHIESGATPDFDIRNL